MNIDVVTILVLVAFILGLIVGVVLARPNYMR
jgi:uncharacterized protein YneF (UPF0154 family)